MRHRWQLPVFLALLVASGLLANLARARPSFAWDHPVAEWIVAIDVPGFHSAMEAVSVPGTTLGVLLSVLVATVAVLVWRGWRSATMIVAVIVANAMNEGFKALVERPRPGGNEFDSFPSGHAMHTVVFFGVLWAVIAPRLPSRAWRVTLGAVMAVAAALVGISRVHLERHWPSDVLGGYLVGGMALWALLWIAGRFLMRGSADESGAETGLGEEAAER